MTVYVTIRQLERSGRVDAVSVYTSGSDMASAPEIPVTTSAAVAPSFVAPRLDAPTGADKDTASESPEGSAAFKDAEIFWFDSLVVMA